MARSGGGWRGTRAGCQESQTTASVSHSVSSFRASIELTVTTVAGCMICRSRDAQILLCCLFDRVFFVSTSNNLGLRSLSQTQDTEKWQSPNAPAAAHIADLSRLRNHGFPFDS